MFFLMCNDFFVWQKTNSPPLFSPPPKHATLEVMQYKTNLALSPALRRFLEPELLDYVEDSLTLLHHFAEPDHRRAFHDYAFVVFPMAKAYEGFLKHLFMDLEVMRDEDYRSRYFRVGRSFNPDLPKHLRNEVWVYDDVRDRVGEQIARQLWQMWIDGRNHIFHYFPDNRHCLSYAQAERLIFRFLEAMELALPGKKLESGRTAGLVAANHLT